LKIVSKWVNMLDESENSNIEDDDKSISNYKEIW